jgi:hypothetical protein
VKCFCNMWLNLLSNWPICLPSSSFFFPHVFKTRIIVDLPLHHWLYHYKIQTGPYWLVFFKYQNSEKLKLGLQYDTIFQNNRVFQQNLLKNSNWDCLQDPFFKRIEYFSKKLVRLSVTESSIKISTQMLGLICFFFSYLLNWHRNVFCS